MSFINSIKDIGRTGLAASIMGLILWMLIKRLPNHTTTQDFGMYFDLLIVLAVLQLFLIIYIGVTPYKNIYKDRDRKKIVEQKKDFLYDVWDWMYPGYGTRGIELDIFIYITYIIIILIMVLIIIIRLTDEGTLKPEKFENPISFGICFLEENGYTIFIYANIFMFLYISRFIWNEIGILSGEKTTDCERLGMISRCWSSEEINKYPDIIKCNDEMKELKCNNDQPIENEPEIKWKLEDCKVKPGLLDDHILDVGDTGNNVILVNNTNILTLNEETVKSLGPACSESVNLLLQKINPTITGDSAGDAADDSAGDAAGDSAGDDAGR